MNATEQLKAILRQRKSTFPKSYTQQPVSPQVIEDIVQAAHLTPNHKRTRPWRFKVFRNEEKEQLALEMARIYKASTPPERFLQKKYDDIILKINASAAIITVSTAFNVLVPEWEEIAATSMGVQNMYLMATTYGLGCYWSTPAYAAQLHSYLELGEDERCLGLFYIGSIE